jgi:histidine triad (HIT) family protein
MEDCLFCKIVKKELSADIVFEDDSVCAFKDISPQAPEHILIIPKKHISTLNDLEPSDRDLAAHLLMVARDVARMKGLDTAGYRLVSNCLESAGQSVFHLHFHLLGGRLFDWPPG